MSHLIHVNNSVYEELTKMKRTKDASYSEVIQEIINKEITEKMGTWEEIIENAKARDKKSTGKKQKIEKIDHDLVLYGVSRESS